MIKIATFNLEKYAICDEIKNLREELNLTQKEFGEFFNIPQSNISMWENYKSAPPNYVISMMWKIINLTKKGEQIHIDDCLHCMELREKNQNSREKEENIEEDFDTWLENQPEGTFVQGGGIDSDCDVENYRIK